MRHTGKILICRPSRCITIAAGCTNICLVSWLPLSILGRYSYSEDWVEHDVAITHIALLTGSTLLLVCNFSTSFTRISNAAAREFLKLINRWHSRPEQQHYPSTLTCTILRAIPGLVGFQNHPTVTNSQLTFYYQRDG